MTSFISLDLEVVLLLLTTFIGSYWLLLTCKTRRYPPGPTPWPVVGHLPNLFGEKRLEFLRWVADRYGPVTTVWIGTQPVILLNTPEAVKDAYLNQAETFNDRPFLSTFQKIRDGKRSGVILNVGESHMAMRRVALMALHDFGLGKQSLEEKVQEEAKALADVLLKSNGQPITNIKRTLQLTIANIIISICFGSRLSYDSEEFTKLMNHLDAFFATTIVFQPETIFPFLRYLPIKTGAQTMIESQNGIKDYIRKQIEHHRVTFDSNNIRDFVDLYLKAEKDQDAYFNVDNLFMVIVDLFAAGAETTTTTISWAILYMIQNPSIQEKARQEITRVLGVHSLPTAKDRVKLVYVDALIHEVLRIAAVVPLSVPRFLEKPAQVCGVELPSGCIVFPNLYHIQLNKRYWKDPEVFRPERWIDDNGSMIKHDYYLPFSIGRRICLGETFAKTETFIVLVMLLQKFLFRMPTGGAEPSPEPRLGPTRAPAPYYVCATPTE